MLILKLKSDTLDDAKPKAPATKKGRMPNPFPNPE